MCINQLVLAIKSLSVTGVDDSTLENIKSSLNMIIDNGVFDKTVQLQAFIKITEINKVLGTRSSNIVEQNKRILEEATCSFENVHEHEHENENECDLSAEYESDQLTRLMIRAREEGAMSFEFRGVNWSWNFALSTWERQSK
jgi:hypothetical protein